MKTITLSSKNQVVIPSSVRAKLGLHSGDRLIIEKVTDKEVVLKKQLRQAKVMRDMQPEIKRVKKEAKGDRQKESAMLMELYKERGVNPIGSIGVLIPQFIILIGLYDALRQVASNPKTLLTLSYSGIHHLPWMQHLSSNIHLFDDTLFGFINLSRSAAGGKGGIYWPAMVLVLGSAIAQFYQSKQLMPSQKTTFNFFLEDNLILSA